MLDVRSGLSDSFCLYFLSPKSIFLDDPNTHRRTDDADSATEARSRCMGAVDKKRFSQQSHTL